MKNTDTPVKEPLLPPVTIDQRLDKVEVMLGNLVNVLASTSSVEKPRPNKPEEEINTEELTKRNMTLSRTLRQWKAYFGLAVALVGLMTGIAGAAWSYIQGYAEDRANRALEIEAAKEVADRVEQHEQRLAKIVSDQEDSSSRLRQDLEKKIEQKIRGVAELQALEAQHTNAVLEALATRKKPPPKSRRLLAAEAAAAGDER